MNKQHPNAPSDSTLVDSLNHPIAGLIRLLLSRSSRHESEKFLIDDEENILQALEAGVEIELVCYTGENGLPHSVQKNLISGTSVHEVAKRTSKKLFGNEKVSRIFAIAKTPKPISIEALNTIKKDVVVLENLGISGNIGNIIRTSLALDIGGIIILNLDPLDIYDRRLIRASRGYVFSVPIITASTEELIAFCKKSEQPLLVTSATEPSTVTDIASIAERLLIVFGSEKEGTSTEIEAAATFKARIPINDKVESLNVSTAAGITLYNRINFNRQIN